MRFDSLTFLLFFAAIVLLYNLLPSWRGQKLLLLLASYLFYAAWSPPLILLVWVSTVVDYFIAGAMPTQNSNPRRRLLLLVSLTVNFGLLSYFKYADFLLESFSVAVASVGIVYQAPELDILLPVGISFYTFQTVSYTIDVYRGQTKPTTSFLDFALFVTFFPQLVAGPIVRADEFLPQCHEPKRSNLNLLSLGVALMLWGLLQKVVLADTVFAPVANRYFNGGEVAGLANNWLGILAFSFQIYCDFSGYTLIAVGAAFSLGFHLPDNFHAPYAARGLQDFWRRWHMSLSRWLKDYLYVSLGGNRRGRWKTARNLLLTMGLGGLWHGAGWTYVLWGVAHGLILGLERLLSVRYLSKIPVSLHILGTFVLVTLLWVLFRSQDLDSAWLIYQQLIDLSQGTYQSFSQAEWLVMICGTGLFSYQFWRKDKHLNELILCVPSPVQAAALATIIVLIPLVSTGDRHAFIYFQF